MMPGPAGELIEAFRKALHANWHISVADGHLAIRHRDAGTPYRPPRRTPDWAELLNRLEDSFASYGVAKAPALPMRWSRETDLTISAVQALDPHLKARQPYTLRSGYLPQPVVRFTGRDEVGKLREGYLTSFVNVSRVQPIKGIDDHANILDEWIGVLSRLGLHARHIEIYGRLHVWRRGPVEGVTLRYRHAGAELGDLVLLRNAENPDYLATDLGTGLERLRWIITRRSWHETVFGPWDTMPIDQIDAHRTAVLLVGAGIAPASRGPGSAVRAVLRAVPHDAAAFGLSRAVRAFHQYWSLTATGLAPWPAITEIIEEEVLRGA
jgi:hypothetical protein